MKKILVVLLATSSVAVFADTFQDFNNNLYVQYNNSTLEFKEAPNFSTQGYALGGTFQTKNNIWANAQISNQIVNGTAGQDTFSLTNVKAGYAFQMFGDDDSGFQVVPYASFGATDSADYSWGVGVMPQYRLMSNLMVSLGIGLQGMNGDGTYDSKSTTLFTFNVNPEVQYDISKTILLGVGYNMGNTFNGNNNAYASTLTAKVGYLF